MDHLVEFAVDAELDGLDGDVGFGGRLEGDFLAGGPFSVPEGDGGFAFGDVFEVVAGVVGAVLDDVDAAGGRGGVDAFEAGRVGVNAELQLVAAVGEDVRYHGVELPVAEVEGVLLPDPLEGVEGIRLVSLLTVEQCDGEFRTF